ncbi:serine hydrolase [Scopulibacillus cellulosilyticus]|uniref:Serine hydrolase n=1 Tax=Scopulibacillus cellulosilyticus TaxID=2665665 RepID=A0ABW2PZK2_9BACL
MLQKKIEQLIEPISGSFGILIRHIQSGEEVKINSERLFQAARCIKIPILITLFRDIEEGKVQLDTRIRIKEEDRVTGSGILRELDPGAEVSIKDLAMLMTIVSDNLATDKILDIVGGVENVDRYMKELGFENIHVKQTLWDWLQESIGFTPQPYSQEYYETVHQALFSGKSFDPESIVFTGSSHTNAMTPLDSTNLLEKMLKKELVSIKASEAMLDMLSRQQLRRRIPYFLPPGTRVANKTGWIGNVVNDVGIIELPEEKGQLIISVFIMDGSYYESESIIPYISKTAFEYFSEKPVKIY